MEQVELQIWIGDIHSGGKNIIRIDSYFTHSLESVNFYPMLDLPGLMYRFLSHAEHSIVSVYYHEHMPDVTLSNDIN